jgi:predicted dienelactone hydrolase
LRRLFYLVIAILVSVFASPNGDAAPPSFHAGIAHLTVPDGDGPFDVTVWYPTPDPEVPWQAGPFTVAASLNAGIAKGQRFPVVLLSHGRGGSPLGHRELAASLARAGFVVVAPTHVGDAAGHPRMQRQSQILMSRPRQAVEALSAALADARFAADVDPARMGMIGYSAGGYTALVLAGAHPNVAAASAYCAAEGRGDPGSCGPAHDSAPQPVMGLENWQPPAEPRLKALVLMDPLSMVFQRGDVGSVRMPVLLFRPEDDAYLKADHNALALARDLPTPPAQIVVPGRHFVFIDPCPEKLAAEAPGICQDAPGVDRVAIHHKIESDIATFLRQHL